MNTLDHLAPFHLPPCERGGSPRPGIACQYHDRLATLRDGRTGEQFDGSCAQALFDQPVAERHATFFERFRRRSQNNDKRE